MTVEFVVVFPVMLIVAVIAVNALLFLSECASFDRLARDAIRIQATSPAYGQTVGQSSARIESDLKEAFGKEYLSCSVTASGDMLGHVTYTASLTFSPTLFGMGLRQSVFGVDLPAFTHAVSHTVDTYKPGAIL